MAITGLLGVGGMMIAGRVYSKAGPNQVSIVTRECDRATLSELPLDTPVTLAWDEPAGASTRVDAEPTNATEDVNVCLRLARDWIERAIAIQAKQLGEARRVVDLVAILDEIDPFFLGKR